MGRCQPLQRPRRPRALGGFRRAIRSSADRHGARIGWVAPELGKGGGAAGRAQQGHRCRPARIRVVTRCGQKNHHRRQRGASRPLHQCRGRRPGDIDGQLDGRRHHDPPSGRTPAGCRRGGTGRSCAANTSSGSRPSGRRTVPDVCASRRRRVVRGHRHAIQHRPRARRTYREPVFRRSAPILPRGDGCRHRTRRTTPPAPAPGRRLPAGRAVARASGFQAASLPEHHEVAHAAGSAHPR